MSKVFVVYDSTFEYVVGVFSTLKKAKNYVASLITRTGVYHFEIDEFVIDKEVFD